MPIHKPQKVLGKSVALKSAAKGIKQRGSRASAASLNLTAMVDMFTLLVVFLLANFSATGEILFMSKDITLPKAASTAELVRAPVISISSNNVALEGSEVIDTDELKRPDVGVIPELTDRLNEMKRADQMLHPGAVFKGTTIIQSDQDIEFSIVKKVMYAAAEAGYVDVNYAVMGTQSTLGDVNAPH